MGEENRVDVSDISAVLKDVKSLDNNEVTLQRTVKHLTKNGVELDKYKMSLGALLKFDPEKEVFTNNDAANAMLTREYREPYVCPRADKV
jgi:hypothetical protein